MNYYTKKRKFKRDLQGAMITGWAIVSLIVFLSSIPILMAAVFSFFTMAFNYGLYLLLTDNTD